jgi:Tfp pilus assembly protein PilN
MKAVNLLPSDQRGSGTTAAVASAPAAKNPAFGAYVLLGFLAIAVAAVAAYVLADNSIKDRKAELARAKQEATAITAKASSLQAYADFKQVADQRVSTVRDLAKARFDWPQALDDLSRVMPADVHLRTVTGTVSSSTGSSNPLRTAIQSPALELSGCTSGQDSVARLMSRLHDIRGVTRVSLASTTKPDGTTGAASSDVATGAQLCPKGSPPDFEIVVFFERNVLGSGAVVNPAAGTGATTATATTPAADGSTTGTTTSATGATATATPAAGTTSTTTTPAATATPAAGTTTSSTTATQGVSAK